MGMSLWEYIHEKTTPVFFLWVSLVNLSVEEDAWFMVHAGVERVLLRNPLLKPEFKIQPLRSAIRNSL